VNLLRQKGVEIANGKTAPQACKEAESTQQYEARNPGNLRLTPTVRSV